MGNFFSSRPSIGFDLLTLPDEAIGTGEYLLLTIEAMQKLLPEVDFRILASKSFHEQNLKKLQGLNFSKAFFINVPNSQVLKSYLQQSLGPAYWFLGRSTIVHSVGYSVPLTLASKRVLNLSRKALRLPTPVLLPILMSTNHVFVESKLMKDEIEQRFKSLHNKISVLCPGVDGEVPEALEAKFPSLDFPFEKYFLHIGSFKEKVRIHNVLEAFSKISHRPRFKNTGIVFLGLRNEDKSEWLELARTYGLMEKVVFLDHQPRDVFIHLLTNCLALIYSGSTLELPPVVYQAVSFEKPVLLSMSNEDKQSFDIGPGLVLFDNSSPKNIAEQLSFSISNEALRQWLKANKKIIQDAHSWNELAKNVIRTYQSLISGTQASESFATSF